MKRFILFLSITGCFIQCSSISDENKFFSPEIHHVNTACSQYDTLTKSIHVFVALCDNTNQDVVPVPEKIGNGQDPANNLYWGCAYGIKTFFKKSIEWELVKTEKINSTILERLIFKHATKNYYLVADAYDGKYIKICTEDFLYGCSGEQKDTLHINKTIIGIQGNAELLSYIGHDGLMDFQLNKSFKNTDNKN